MLKQHFRNQKTTIKSEAKKGNKIRHGKRLVSAADQSLAHSKPSSAAGFLPMGNHSNDFYAQTAFPEPKNHHQIRGKKKGS